MRLSLSLEPILFIFTQINKMSNPFEIAAKATTPTPLSVPHLVVPAAARPGPRPKPLAERRTLYSL
jgi:hypothetical protein